MAYKQRGVFSTPFMFLVPTTEKYQGVEEKKWPKEGPLIYASYSSFGGSERESNDLITTTDSGQITTWYRPDITSACRLRHVETGREYDIVTQPQNIEFRGQYMQFRVLVREGGA